MNNLIWLLVGLLFVLSCKPKENKEILKENADAVQPETLTFNKAGAYFPRIQYVKKWNKWIIHTARDLTFFDTYKDYMEHRAEPHSISIRNDSAFVSIKYGTTGGDIYPAEQNWYRTHLNNQETDLIIITETHRSPEVTDSEIHIGKIKNDSFEDLTDQYFPEIRASLFFPGVDSVAWMKKMVDWEFAYDHNSKKVIVTPVERYYMTCNNKLMPDVAKDSGITPEQICETWKAYSDTPIDFIWNGSSFSPEQQH